MPSRAAARSISVMRFDVLSIGKDHNVKNHITQDETSHFPQAHGGHTKSRMDENETFRLNLLRIMAEKGFDAANLSRAAKLNPGAVKDIEERRAARLSNVKFLI